MKMGKMLEVLRILAALEKACGRVGGFRLGQVNEFSSFSRTTTYHALKKLENFGAVKREKNLYRNEQTDHYSITPAGKTDWLGQEIF